MPVPTYVTAVNTKFDKTTQNAVTLSIDTGIKSLVLWDALSVADQNALDAVIVARGGVAPMAGPVAGFNVLDFGGSVVGGNATGLAATAAAAGTATINVGGNKAGGTASGLSAALGVAGKQVVNLQPGVAGTDATGLFGGSAGSQVVNVGANKTGATATGLAGATTYTATITVDSVAKSISILGSAAATYTTLLSELNVDLAGAATATLVGGNIIVTSATSGATSTVAIADTTLFAALTGFVSIVVATAGIAATTYTATITVDGVAKSISVVGNVAQTFTALIAELNTDLASAATAVLAGGDIRVTSATFGTTSKVVITPGTLFPAITGFVSVLPPQNGAGAARQYSATVTVDGAVKTVRFSGVQGATFTNVLTEINADLGASATAAIVGGNIVITSATTGANSSVRIQDSGLLFASLTGYAGIATTQGTASAVYTATITVDGVVKPVSVVGSAAQTYTTLLAAINTAIGASATAAIVAGDIKITSATTGLASKVSVADSSLFKAVTGFRKAVATDGSANLVDVLKSIKVGSGSLYDTLKIVKVGTKPAVPPYCPHTKFFTYYDGAIWRYLDNDVAF